jgi:hypothetical protein
VLYSHAGLVKHVELELRSVRHKISNVIGDIGSLNCKKNVLSQLTATKTCSHPSCSQSGREDLPRCSAPGVHSRLAPSPFGVRPPSIVLAKGNSSVQSPAAENPGNEPEHGRGR